MSVLTARLGALGVPSLCPKGTWKELLKHNDGKRGASGVRGQSPEGMGQRLGWHLPAGN